MPYQILIITTIGTPGHDELVHILCLSRAWPSISIKAMGRQTIWIQGTIDVYLFQCLHSVEESCYPGRMVLFMENSRNGTVHMMDPVFFCSGKPHPCRVFLPRLLSPPGILRCQCYKKTCAYLHLFSLFSYTLIENQPVTQICDPECVSMMWPGNKPRKYQTIGCFNSSTMKS